ncbi:MAG: uracil-DNA glycosylase [Clostridiales bacterium]|jgi:uracil-DNA glycosylase|nr:uracil-DNA glycosylase [Clostridiales bacterium]MDR2749862.1 uracil-DNA glycosylase [Clostridiales bacterium]
MPKAPTIGNSWDEYLQDEFKQPYYQGLRKFLVEEYKTRTIYPKAEDIFNAFKLSPIDTTKVVILGQDPYINQGEAHGLAFSVNKGVKVPPSLKNVYKELKADLGIDPPSHGCLADWAKQGVLLLNATLTVRAGDANHDLGIKEKGSKSHFGMGWEIFTNSVVRILNDLESPLVFLLWGNNAKAKAPLVSNSRHLKLTAAHPSPLAGNAFSGCKHFSQANEFLEKAGRGAVDWRLAE